MANKLKLYNTKYYELNEFDVKNSEYVNKGKKYRKINNEYEIPQKLSIIHNKDLGKEKTHKIFDIINRIYRKNESYAFNVVKTKPINSNLINIVASVPLLIASYNKIRKNRKNIDGTYNWPSENYSKLKLEASTCLNKLSNFQNKINKNLFCITSKLIKQGKYPWGTSKKIYVDKLIKNYKTMPIKIPILMDRIVQEAITTVLKCIYEPYFESLNCSFGFRPDKNLYGAIKTIKDFRTIGLKMVLNGNIKSVYKKFNTRVFIDLLNNKIQDRKFINLIKKRLDYETLKKKKEIYSKVDEDVAQILAYLPYLLNVYMLEFDIFISKLLEGKSNKSLLLPHQKLILRSIYIRYVDEWIIITNLKKQVLEEIKVEIKKYLKKSLSTVLTIQEGLITNMSESPIRFLGFEINNYVKKVKITKIKQITTESNFFFIPDKEKFLNKFYINGYCEKKGFPKEFGFIINFQDSCIIERFNSVLLGIHAFYMAFVNNPKRNLSRWIYIIKYSCVKTLAQKHKTSIKKIFKKYLMTKEKGTRIIKAIQ